MPGLEIQSRGEVIATYDGSVIEDAKWNMDYDGKHMDIESVRDDEYSYIQLDNQDIMRLLNGVGSDEKMGLEDRLKNDFPHSYNHNNITKRVRFMPENRRKSVKNKHSFIVSKRPKQKASPKKASPKRKVSPKHKKKASPKHKKMASPKQKAKTKTKRKKSNIRKKHRKTKNKNSAIKIDAIKNDAIKNDAINREIPDIEKTIY